MKVFMWLFLLFFNIIVGGLCTQYTIEFWVSLIRETQFTIPFLPCAVVGLFFGELFVPAAIVTWIISFCL